MSGDNDWNMLLRYPKERAQGGAAALTLAVLKQHLAQKSSKIGTLRTRILQPWVRMPKPLGTSQPPAISLNSVTTARMVRS